MARQKPEKEAYGMEIGQLLIHWTTPRGTELGLRRRLRALGVDDPDGRRVHIFIEILPGKPIYGGEKTLKSGPEVYGADIAEVVAPTGGCGAMPGR